MIRYTQLKSKQVVCNPYTPGFDSWSNLKKQIELETTVDFQTYFCSQGSCGFPNHWCNNYHQAKVLQMKEGGILLPYRHQFFVAPVQYLEKLGFSQNASDWQSIDYDRIVSKSIIVKQAIMEKSLQTHLKDITIKYL